MSHQTGLCRAPFSSSTLPLGPENFLPSPPGLKARGHPEPVIVTHHGHNCQPFVFGCQPLSGFSAPQPRGHPRAFILSLPFRPAKLGGQ